jgi:rRNA maturation RNase YbeY
MLENKVSIINKTKGKLPRLPFTAMKKEILGKNYSLSIAFVDAKKSKEINKKYRGKNKPTNILSFSLRKNEGELVLCPSVIRKEAKNFGRTFEKFLGFLVIHGMLHLKGHEHSSTMERAEEAYDKKYFGGNRLGIRDDESHSRRVHKRRKKS